MCYNTYLEHGLQEHARRETYLPRGFASASVGSFRMERSERFLDTACSRNDDFPFDRRLLEKLSLLNILDG